MYTPFGGVYPEDENGLGSLNRDGVQYRWTFRNGQAYMGVWLTMQTYSGYQFQSRVC